MEQEHRLTYKAGITRTPSDFLCSDGELAECINLATDTEELKPMVQPVQALNTQAIHTHAGVPISENLPVIYIHRYNDQKRYIYTRVSHSMDPEEPDSYRLYWGYDDDGSLEYGGTLTSNHSKLMKVTSIGKTLIVTADDGMHYYLWKEDVVNGQRVMSYKSLGDLKAPDIKLYMVGSTGITIRDKYGVTNSLSYNGILRDNATLLDRADYPDAREKYNELIKALYAKNKKSVANKKAFCEPFMARVALELTDGTYTHISQPVMLFPSITKNSVMDMNVNENQAILRTDCCHLCYINNCFTDASHQHETQFYDDWSDIVKDIVIFVTREVSVYDVSVDQPLPYALDSSGVYYDAIFSTGGGGGSEYREKTGAGGYTVLKTRETDEIRDDLIASSIFYKLCSIGRTGDGVEHDASDKIQTHTLENLTTQDRLEYDDYYSNSRMYPQFMYSYNSRLNIASVRRSMFEGFGYFLPWDNSTAARYTFDVTIRTDEGDKVVRHEEMSTQKQGIFFYYPDSRAKHVVIYKDDFETATDKILDEDLKEHPGLNGAYYFAGLPGASHDEPVGTSADIPSHTEPDPERLPNYIIQSDVNNPWVFKAEGYHKVGTGKIVGMSTTTQALSMSQYGPFPLLVFSESGVWAMSVDKTGLYKDMQPISRDICLAPSTITQTDGAVFFVSKKGLMVAERAGNGLGVQIGCVSERMNGVTFNTSSLSPLATGTDWAGIVSACQGDTSFLNFVRSDRCFMAYDYIDSRLMMINPTYSYSYVYNMADGTISKTVLPSGMLNAVNDYPDYLLQGSDGYLYSFYEKPREEEVVTRQLAFMLTRPMKLAGPVSQASLRQLMNVGTWKKRDAQGNELSCVKTEIYLSEDMQTWFPDISRFGAAARYYRLALYIKMLPTERLSGTILTEQPRRSNNMR